MHDFNPGITPNGVFWIVQVPDEAVQITEDSITIHLQDVTVIDQLFFPGGTGNATAAVTFDATYTKSGSPRHVRPTSDDPLSQFHWAGEMWRATNSGSFSLAYDDASFSAKGTFASDVTNPDTAGFGQLGTERNGSFVKREDTERAEETNIEEQQAQKALSSSAAPASVQMSAGEKFAMAWRSSRARAVRAWKSKP